MQLGVLTVTTSRTAATDASGGVLAEAFDGVFERVERGVVDDDVEAIQAAMLSWIREWDPDCILTTGGTGLDARDVTPEAVRGLLDREAPGIATMLTVQSLAKTPMAALSRFVAGVKRQTLIICLPGSPKACRECAEMLHPVLRHAIDTIRGRKRAVQKVHHTMQADTATTGNQDHTVSAPTPPAHTGCNCGRDAPVTSVQTSDYPVFYAAPPVPSETASERGSGAAARHRKSPYPMLPWSMARQRGLEALTPLRPVQRDVAAVALHEVLASPVTSTVNVPAYPASIKDGYAVRAADVDVESSASPVQLTVQGVSTAGAGWTGELPAGAAARISTGAPVPVGADAVVQVEDTRLIATKDGGAEEACIEILHPVSQGQDIRPPGCDVQAGATILDAGVTLGAAECALLRMCRVAMVDVVPRPTVCVFSTGDELIADPASADEQRADQVIDTNRPMLLDLLRAHGFDVVDGGILPDDREQLEGHLRTMCNQVDVMITSGGVSMGEKDFVKDMIFALGGEVQFGRVWLKPGKPTTMGTFSRTDSRCRAFFGLPGNPVSAFVTWHLFVLPCLHKLAGRATGLPVLWATLAEEVKLDARPEFQRVELEWASVTGALPVVVPQPGFLSSNLTSATRCNALLELPGATAQQPSLPRNARVQVHLLGV